LSFSTAIGRVQVSFLSWRLLMLLEAGTTCRSFGTAAAGSRRATLFAIKLHGQTYDIRPGSRSGSACLLQKGLSDLIAQKMFPAPRYLGALIVLAESCYFAKTVCEYSCRRSLHRGLFPGIHAALPLGEAGLDLCGCSNRGLEQRDLDGRAPGAGRLTQHKLPAAAFGRPVEESWVSGVTRVAPGSRF